MQDTGDEVADVVGTWLMTAAYRLRQSSSAGVIVNEHTLSALQTRAHVEAFGRWFDFIHHDELFDRLARPRSRPFCLLTLDDGKRSVATETAPELERLGVPAAIYVVTRFLTEGMPLWFDRQEAISRLLGYTPRGLEQNTLKRLPHSRMTELLDRASLAYDAWPDMEDDNVRPMSWSDARDLTRRGFTIGSHSLRHSILTCEPETEALSDIEQSIAEVSDELGARCTTFAFPNGNYTPRLAQHALKCGAKTVMTTEPMWVDGGFPPWRLPRVQFFGQNSRAKIELKLAAAATGRFLANPNGTGRSYRKMGRCAFSATKY